MNGSLLSLFVVSFFMFSCGSDVDKHIEDASQAKKVLQMMESKCYACHSPTLDDQATLAPPMIAIKEHYLSQFPNKTDFVNHLAAFTINPTQGNAIMQDAVKRFGIMPNMNLSKEDSKLIADYIFQNEIARPDWYGEEIEKANEITGIDVYKQKGLDLALKTKKVLGKNLMGQINQNGTVAAVSFCSEAAYPIVDSMSTELNAKIKRVSDLPRNINNTAQGDELKYIEKTKLAIANNQQPRPQIKEVDDAFIGYYPIMTNPMCLQCHGAPSEDIKPQTLAKIKAIYPKDKAIGYSSEELRGIWVVEMDK